MKAKDQIQWQEQNKKLNENLKIKIGMEVTDVDGNKGIVVKIVKWEGDTTDENHGTVYVWQSERTDYGPDNCEHYSLNEWKTFLRILYK